jgi:serine/threonine-protein kinase
MNDEQLTAGTTFAGFTIDELVGRGGMSEVYRATDAALGRRVALKVMAPALSADRGFRDRFISEARAASHLDHPNVIPIYGAGEHDGRLFIAMRYVTGGADLRKLLRREQHLPAAQALALLAQAAGALDAVHGAGMVHRDVKPDNLLLANPDETDGVAHLYLTDFGLTRAATQERLTQDGQVVGTLAYAPPEQIRGEEVGPAADVYALGCVLFECLAGRRPFVRDNDAALMYAHLSDPPPSLQAPRPELGSAIDAVVARALAKNPAERFPTCTDLVNAAAAALDITLPDLHDDTPTISHPRLDHVGSEPNRAATATPSQPTRDATPPTGPTGATTGPRTPVAIPAAVDPDDVAEIATPAPETATGGGRNPWPLRAAAAVLVLVVLGAGTFALVRRGGGDDPFTFRFARTTHEPSGITVDRAWTLQGDAGDQVAGSVEIVNPTAQTRTYTHDEVVPKDLADHVDRIAFSPAYSDIVEVDPVVRYRLDVAPKSTTTLRWTVTITPSGRDPQRLQALAAAWGPAFDAYQATDQAKQADTATANPDPGTGEELAGVDGTTTPPPPDWTDVDLIEVPPPPIDPQVTSTAPTGDPSTGDPNTGDPNTGGGVTPTGPTVTYSVPDTPKPPTVTPYIPPLPPPPPPPPPTPTAWNGQTCTVVGTAGNDTLRGTAGGDVLCGLGGNDVLLPGAGDDIIDGGTGTDMVSYEDSSRAVSLNLAQQSAWWIAGYPNQTAVSGNWDQFGGTIENGRASNYADVLTGRPSAERFEALGGDDFINVYDGADYVDSGAGNDTCYTDGYAVWTVVNCEKHS